MINIAKYANKKICVALSGGRDSMALAHYLLVNGAKFGITLSALNCDHRIRGEASRSDSEFVRRWCAENKIPLMSFVRDEGCGCDENGARRWRLSCYVKAVSPTILPDGSPWLGADAIATAHHQNDNAETVLFNLARGSALSGLTGITDTLYEGVQLIRPMIDLTRREIDEYIKANNIPYVDDESNFGCEYTRNKIRLNVLPALEDAIPCASSAIYRFSRLAKEDEEYFDNLIEDMSLIRKIPHGVEIKQCRQKVVFRRAVLKALTLLQPDIHDYTLEQFNSLYNLQFLGVGKRFEFLKFTAFCEDGKITITYSPRENPTPIDFEWFVNGEKDTYFGEELSVKPSLSGGCDGYKILMCDLDKIPKKAKVRTLEAGDKFKKFGGGTKSLGDFFTDRKIPLRLRGIIPLICDGSRVLVVCGVEISDDVKIDDSTKNIAHIKCRDYKNI